MCVKCTGANAQVALTLVTVGPELCGLSGLGCCRAEFCIVEDICLSLLEQPQFHGMLAKGMMEESPCCLRAFDKNLADPFPRLAAMNIKAEAERGDPAPLSEGEALQREKESLAGIWGWARKGIPFHIEEGKQYLHM